MRNMIEYISPELQRRGQESTDVQVVARKLRVTNTTRFPRKITISILSSKAQSDGG